MTTKWMSTAYPGVRCYEHNSRRMRNGKPDRYYAIRYYIGKARKEEGVGWASEGWSPEKAHKLLGEIKESIRTGSGPQTLADRRQARAAQDEAARAEAVKQARAAMTLGDFVAEIFMPKIQQEKRSWRSDAYMLGKILPTLGHIPLQALRKEDALAFFQGLVDKGMAPATVRHYMAVLRYALNVALETSLDGVPLLTGRNPLKGIRLAAVHNARVRYLESAEVDRLLHFAQELGMRDLHDAIVLSLNTGLRAGELARLRWLDIDLAGQVINVPIEDRRKPGGTVPMNQAARTVLLARRELTATVESGLVFLPQAGGRGESVRDTISRQFARLADAAGINAGIEDRRHRIVFHSLRHTFASWLALAGTDIYRIKTLMRHKNISMTMRYAHLIPDVTRSAVENLRPPAT